MSTVPPVPTRHRQPRQESTPRRSRRNVSQRWTLAGLAAVILALATLVTALAGGFRTVVMTVLEALSMTS
ncbi:hypothetical protein [Catellatospora vulcania]|uniref:hypothetical protein n=1 Tax=Catellatospora vulcania TaxID=1460450 RepID=UPI0012D45F47|nr:hypothetical protein [Catellatospora vulcania]